MGRAVDRATVVDAEHLAAVQITSWRAAFAGLLAASELAALNVEDLQGSWEQKLVDEADAWPRTGTLAVREDGRLVGYSRFYPTEDRDDDPARVATIGSIYSLPEGWGTGVGTALMSAVVSTLAEAGYRESTLWVLRGNLRAQSFYRSRGWAQDHGVEQILSGDEAVEKLRFRRVVPSS